MKSEYSKIIKTEEGEEKVSLILSKIDEKTYEIIRDIPDKYTASEIEEELLKEVCKDADKEGITLHLIDVGEIELELNN